MSGYNPGIGPYNNPQITIANPLAPPGLQLTNVQTLLQANMAGVWIFKDGLLLTKGTDYTLNGAQITFTVAPISSDVIVASVFQLGLQLGGAAPQRYVAPVSFPVIGAYDSGRDGLRDRDGPDDLRGAGRRLGTVYLEYFLPTCSDLAQWRPADLQRGRYRGPDGDGVFARGDSAAGGSDYFARLQQLLSVSASRSAVLHPSSVPGNLAIGALSES